MNFPIPTGHYPPMKTKHDSYTFPQPNKEKKIWQNGLYHIQTQNYVYYPQWERDKLSV